jgi:tetratricopeptide (TPR) repeat protein
VLLITEGDDAKGGASTTKPSPAGAGVLSSKARDELRARVIARLERSVASAPDDRGARYRLAEGLALAGDGARARREYTRVLEGEGEEARRYAARVRFDRAVLITAGIDHDLARAADELLVVRTSYPTKDIGRFALRERARLLHELGRDDEALLELEAAIAAGAGGLAPTLELAWFCVAERVAPARGLAAVSRALTRVPARDGAELLLVRAWLEEHLGNPARALSSVRALIEREPRSAHHRRHARRLLALTGASAPAGAVEGEGS